MYNSGRTNISVFACCTARPNCYVVNELLYKKSILFVGSLISHNSQRRAQQHPSSRTGDHSSEHGAWPHMLWRSHTTVVPSASVAQSYNCSAKCQYSCTKNVLCRKVHSSLIPASYETSLSYKNSKHRNKMSLIHVYIPEKSG